MCIRDSSQDVPTLAAARKRGCIPARAEDLSIAGELFAVPDFKLVTERSSLEFALSLIHIS